MEEMIYKKPLLKDLKGIKEVLMGQGDPVLASMMNRAIACVEKQPVADAVPVVHGRWAALDDDCEELEGEEEAMRWGCSACREIVEYDDWTHRSRLTRYCPNCGAKMDGERKDNG